MLKEIKKSDGIKKWQIVNGELVDRHTVEFDGVVRTTTKMYSGAAMDIFRHMPPILVKMSLYYETTL